MLQFFKAKQEKQEKKVENDIADMFKAQVKKKYCQICQKNIALKVGFGKQFKPCFTCAGCELKAVGSPQKLGPKYLISIEKYIEILTKQIMNYQTTIKSPPNQFKKPSESFNNLKQKSTDLSLKINEQYKKMKKIAQEKEQQIIEESLKQNSILIFQEMNKLVKEKKINQIDNGNLILKRALCNSQGLRFTDTESIEQANEQANLKFGSVIKQSKIKLKQLEDIIEQINNIQLE